MSGNDCFYEHAIFDQMIQCTFIMFLQTSLAYINILYSFQQILFSCQSCSLDVSGAIELRRLAAGCNYSNSSLLKTEILAVMAIQADFNLMLNSTSLHIDMPISRDMPCCQVAVEKHDYAVLLGQSLKKHASIATLVNVILSLYICLCVFDKCFHSKGTYSIASTCKDTT